jgi:sigma-B regulation protein RsbU (phosphoserine phosphatase)
MAEQDNFRDSCGYEEAGAESVEDNTAGGGVDDVIEGSCDIEVEGVIGGLSAEQIRQQLDMAGQVQRNFLPRSLPRTDQVHFETYFEPAEWVSGDIFDVVRLDEEHIGFYIADAVGHSLPAALLTMFVKHTIELRQTRINSYKIFEPWQVLENLNIKMVAQDLKGCLFVTCCYCLLNIETLELTFARGGHPYPIVIRNGQFIEQLESTGPLIGVFDHSRFEQKTVKLEPGDKVLIHSDGVDPALGRSTENGLFAFRDSFKSIVTMPLGAMMTGLEHLIRQKKLPEEQRDDVTVVAMEVI